MGTQETFLNLEVQMARCVSVERCVFHTGLRSSRAPSDKYTPGWREGEGLGPLPYSRPLKELVRFEAQVTGVRNQGMNQPTKRNKL